MLERTKVCHTKTGQHIKITVVKPSGQKESFEIPNSKEAKKNLQRFLDEWTRCLDDNITRWGEAKPWEEIAKDRIARYSKAGLALRGARYREGLSQKKLAELCNISQDNLSRMENGKRPIGEKIAKRLAKALKIDYRLLLSNPD